MPIAWLEGMCLQYKTSTTIRLYIPGQCLCVSIALSLLILGGCASNKAEVAVGQDKGALQLQLDEMGKSQAEQFMALGKQLTKLRNRMDASEAAQKEQAAQFEARLNKLEKKIEKVTMPATPEVKPVAAPHKRKPGHKTRERKKIATRKAMAPPHPPKQAPAISNEEIKRIYFKAYLTLKSGDYDQASTELRNFLTKFPASRYTQQASYWLGETLLAQGKVVQAIEAFKKVADAQNKSPKQKSALLRLGQLYNKLGNTGKAKATLSRLTREYPQSSEAETARKILSSFAGSG